MRYFRSPSRFRSVAYATLLVGVTVVGIVPWRPVAQAQDDAAKPTKNEGEKAKSFGANMGFEKQENSTRPAAWAGGGKGYTLTLDGEEKHSGDEPMRGILGVFPSCRILDDINYRAIYIYGPESVVVPKTKNLSKLD